MAPPLRAGLEHRRPAAAAARLQIEDEPGVGRQGIVGEEGVRAQQTRLLAVGDHHHHVARRNAGDLDRPDDLQDRRDAGDVVGRAGRAWHAVVVGHQGQGRQGVVAAGQDADDILDVRAAHIGFAAEHLGAEALVPLDLR